MPIATHLPGLDGDYVSHGETGLLVPPRDPRSLAEAIGHLWTNSDVAAVMGQRARAFVEKELALDLWMERMVARLRMD